jgi:hypothetical protein
VVVAVGVGDARRDERAAPDHECYGERRDTLPADGEDPHDDRP